MDAEPRRDAQYVITIDGDDLWAIIHAIAHRGADCRRGGHIGAATELDRIETMLRDQKPLRKA